MRAFWRKSQQVEPSAPEVEPFSAWSILTELASGQTMELRGFVYKDVDQAEMLRYVEAVRDGLTAAGFSASVALTHETRTTLS